jgi:hypothetical protein
MNRSAKAEFSCFVKGFIAFFALSFSIYFTTCDLPMGLGDPIDWEPPVLKIIPDPPNPMYVKQDAVLTGTVTDNVGVEKVLARAAADNDKVWLKDKDEPGFKVGDVLFTAELQGSDHRNRTWTIVMNFDHESWNNEKIAMEIIAWDRAGNTGDQSMAALTIVVDIGPPLIEDIWIQRTEIRKADLERYSDPTGNGLLELETIDRLGERSANIERYQNGFFHIAGKVAETETRIEILSLNIYDSDRDQDTPLLELTRETSSTDFSPRWLISEEALLDKGETLWPGYKNAYYNENVRYYYRVSITALDRSNNENNSEGDLVVEDQGYFVMWQNADIPKGILDPVMGVTSPIIVTKGSTLPVEFFDDDQLLWAYTGLLTLEQWRGEKIDEENGNRSDIFIADGIKIPEGDDQAKLRFLRDRLRSSQPVFNWEYDRYTDREIPINDVVAGQSLNEKIVYVQTGNSDLDNGEYVLFALVADKKLAPHTGDGPYDTNRTREAYRVWRVDVIDENEPLIVFDTVITTDPSYSLGSIGERPIDNHPGGAERERKGLAYNTGDSPEDNTFPKLLEGRYFTVNGYTLRANKQSTENEVIKFRMAWIPFGIGPGETPADNYIGQVQRALSSLNYPASFNSLPSTIQHWEFEPVENAANKDVYDKGKLIKGSDQDLDENSPDIFRKQVFKKTFDLLGGPDDLKGVTNGYYNFRPNGSASALENETKLFVFYAEDNMGHVVYRQLRLLGNKTPPTLAVYDITGMDDIEFINSPRRLPNLNNDNSADGDEYYFFNSAGNIEDEARRRYEASLALYQPYGHQSIVNAGAHMRIDTDRDRTEPYTAYPRDTIVKYWVTAARSGDLNVEDISMRDITYSTNDIAVGYYNGINALSYVEMLPEITQRVFLFEAEDTLGNKAQLQRTVAVTNAAVLNNITTATQNGSYGIDQVITLQANFSNLVKWTGTNPPKLNVRHKMGGISGSPMISQIETKTPKDTSVLFLEFDFVIEEGCTGVLETMYFGMDIPAGDETNRNNRPITIPTGTRILDASRGDDAFTPRNSLGFDWTALGQGNSKSLQGSKTITLDGIRPVITGFTLNPPTGKKLYTDSNPGYYFKTDETIQFTLTANKPIFTSTSGEPIVEFQIGSSWINAVWQRASGANGMVFSVLVNSTNTPIDGTVTGIRLKDVSKIVDGVGNAFNAGSSTYTLFTRLDPAVAIHVDKSPPAAAGTTLTGTPLGTVTAGSTTNTLYFNANPTLAIDNSSGENAPVEKTQYSLNNGVTWVDFPKATDGYTDDDPATDDSAIAALGWTTSDTPTTLKIVNGQWTLVTRYIDRAGNIGGLTTQPIHVNAYFPNLIAVTAVQPNGWYKAGENLQFKLDFSEAVRVQNDASVQIVLTNRGSTPNTDGSGNNNMLLQAAAGQGSIDRAGNTTITFSWTNITGKEMRDGMYISSIRLSGLRDNFVNSGPGTTLTPITYNASTTAPSPIGAPFASPQINNLGVTISNNNVNAVKVDAIAPTVSTYSPVNNTGVSSYPGDANAADKRNVITLTFSETVQKGSGTITIKPKSDFLIPPVFEDNGYYMDCVTEEKASASSNRTIWIPGFYDIYNNNSLNAADRNRLTESTTEESQRTSPSTGIPSSEPDNVSPSMTRLRLDARTGQPVGPYVKTTQGLKSGYGYSGLYNGGNNANNNTSDSAETAFFKQGPNTDGSASGLNGAMLAHSAMIPDTATKWVLAYQYSIHNAAGSQETPTRTANGYGKANVDANVVPNIREVLVKTKFRQQEIDVAWSNVVVSGSTVTITLSEPLLKGLQWELSYPEGTFTDQAGNRAAAIGTNAYTFWSEGVQKPVIRVNRKSYDARTYDTNPGWHTPRPSNQDHSGSYTYAAPAANTGWGITDFNTVDYRIESETPGASISYGVTELSNSTTTGTGNGAFNAVSVTGNWTGNVPNVTAVANQYTQDAWDRATPDQPRSFWVRPNLIRRDGYSGQGDAWNATARCRYYVNGDIRYSAGTLRMFRSYNRDATSQTANGFTGLDVLTLSGTQAGGWYKGTVTFGEYEAGKRYVVATAGITNGGTAYTSNRGYEGVFRTLIVLNGQTGSGRNNANGEQSSRGKILVEGSNIKAGMPSVAGFPVQDGSDSGDSRFAKMMFNVDSANPNGNISANETTNQRFYWVSTEIVCEWYFVYFGNGGRYMRTGDVNNYMMVSYGDLTYGYRVHRFPD